MSLTETELNQLTTSWKKQNFDHRLADYKHRLYPQIDSPHTPLGNYFTYVFDFQRSQLVYLSRAFNSLMGYQLRKVPHNGLRFLETILFPADLPAVYQGYQKIWEYLGHLPLELHHQFRAALDFRVRRSDGSSAKILQEMQNFVCDNSGCIVYVAGRCVDITSWSKGQTISLVMEDPSGVQCLQIPSQQDQIALFLSNREKEVLKLLAFGLSSKAIADDLDISYHTVNTHRQNILNKFGIRKTAGLVNYALNHGII